MPAVTTITAFILSSRDYANVTEKSQHTKTSLQDVAEVSW